METTVEPVRSFEDIYRAEWASVRRAVGLAVGDADPAREWWTRPQRRRA
ncbi:MAG TPA: hypothetical protein VFB77_18355 [Acidimicrobiales bacterium]|nr:hypothetical protein [Acidimicrobiales bacterium]